MSRHASIVEDATADEPAGRELVERVRGQLAVDDRGADLTS
jgi:hypothetical protein